MEASDHIVPGTTSENRWQLLGGDRFYILARWLVIILLFATSRLLTGEPIWPPLASTDPGVLLIWGYAAFALVATVALFTDSLAQIRRATYLFDILAITMLSLFSRSEVDLFYPLYLLPLLGTALQMSSWTSLVFGLIAAAGYVTAFLLSPALTGADPAPREPLVLVALSLRAAALVFIPWLAGGLAVRSGLANKQSVARADQRTQEALSDAQAYRDRMRALYEVAYTLSTTLNYQSVLDQALVESRKLVPYTCSLVFLSTGAPDELYIAASQGLREEDRDRRILIEKGAIGQTLRVGNPTLIADVRQEPELQSLMTLQRCRSAIVVPLRAALRTYGVMLIASEQSGAFAEEQVEMITAIANYAIIALHNAQLIHDLREERAKLISKEEEVRHQLARDLHDGPAQALAAITMNIEFIKRLLDRDPQRVVTELDKLSALSKRTTHEVRTMLFELRPLVLETQGLETTLQQYFERLDGKGAQIVLEAKDVTAQLDTKSEGTLFNIIQESVNNAIKHAQAKHIWVTLKQTQAGLEATIQDDGRGFDMQKVLGSYEQRGSFGLLNIEERAKLIGGVSEMHSAPGQGTTVRVIVPLND